MPEPHSPSFLLCQEHYTFQQTNADTHSTLTNTPSSPLTFPDNHHLLLSLLSKESATHSSLSPHNDVVRWIFRVSDHYGFTPLTTVLAINYFDRFVKSIGFQIEEPPWMTQLVAVACVSLAAKVEETQVPLLLDLQVPSKYVEETIFVFEAKTIQRMELLVLSTLEWKMNPVTPISFFQHILTRLGLKRHLHWEFLCRCQRVLLSVIADSRVMSYLPSTLAAAIMIHVIKEIEPCNATEYRNQLLGLLKSSEEQVNGYYKLMLRLLACCEGIRNLGQRPKRLSEPSSPDDPAVDPLDSISTMLPPRIVGEEHYDTAQRVKQTLQRYKELQNIIAIFGLDELSEEDHLTVVRAQKIERFLSQSFFVAEELWHHFQRSQCLRGEKLRTSRCGCLQ